MNELIEKIRAAIARVRTELITQLNVVATAVLLFIANSPNAPTDDLVALLPGGLAQGVAKVAIPMLWGILVQIAVERIKKRAAAEAVIQARIDQIGA